MFITHLPCVMKRGLVLVGAMMAGMAMYAQVSSYAFSTTTGVALEDMTTAITFGISGDDVASPVTSIGFTFNFNGVNYTQFSSSTNGLTTLGATAVATAWTNSLNSGLYNPKIAAWWDDQHTGTGGTVKYKLTGTAPNRRLVVQWNLVNCCAGIPDKTYQLWLNETTNTIQFVYGSMTGFTSSSVGLCAALGDFNAVNTSTNTNYTTGTEVINTVLPTSGRQYTFTPAAACAGTPAAGSVPATASICAGAVTGVVISATGFTGGAGIAYQWEESDDNGVADAWANAVGGTGATTTNYTTPVLVSNRYYRMKTTCTTSGLFNYTGSCMVTVGAAPLGDVLANPIIIPALPYTAAGNNLASNCFTNNIGQSSPDVYYRVVPTCNGTLNINTCAGGGTLTDTYLHILDAAGTILASNDDNGPSCAGLLSSINYTVSAGTTYYIVAEGFSTGQGTYNLSVSNTALFATWFADADGDTYGDPSVTTTTCDGIAPSGYVGNNLDCNDANAAVNPAATEICNGIDDDCDALTDDADPGVTGLSVFFEDADGDGFGNGAVTVFACALAPGYSVDPSDCDDTQSTVYPGATEICDGLDNDCNGEYDEGVVTATVTPAVGASTCKPNFFTFSANTGVGYTYQWFKNGNIITGATNSTYATNKPAYYQVQVNVPGGCFAVSTESFLAVNPGPNANIFAPNGTSLCTTVKLKASYDATYSWQWYKDDGAIPGATGYLYFPTTAGVYYCSITTAAGCTRNTATLAVSACREDEPVAAASALFEVYPNPSAGDFNLSMELNTTETNAQVAVLNMLGEQIYSGNMTIAFGTVNETISLPEATSAGMYIVRVMVAGQEFTKQLSIVK